MTDIKPYFWNAFQQLMGAPDFKRELYNSVLPASGRLLDFGCATGHVADVFARFDYYGVDIDENAIRTAAAQFREHRNMQFLAVDIHARPFSAEYFDDVLFAGTAHHVDDHTFCRLLSDLRACLKQTGSIHLIDPVLQDGDRWQQRFMRRIDRGRFPRSVAQLKSLISSTGVFEIEPPTIHPTYGALIRDCDFAYLRLRCR